MQRTLRTLSVLAALVPVATGLVACGGGDGGNEASSDTDVNTLLDKTFTGSKDVESGKIDLSLKVEATGSGGTGGPVSVSLTGPFESQGAKKLPKFAMTVDASGMGQNLKAGATSTGEKGFVNFNGTDYVVSDEVFNQFKTGFEQAAAQNSGKEQQSLASLGLDPKKWLTDPKNAGEGKVGDTDVIRITGGLDVPKFLDDVNTAIGKAGQLGVNTGQLPTKLTEEQKQQVQEAVKDVKVEIDTGKEDTILRRMKVDLSAADPSGQDNGTATLAFDLQLLDLNEGQEFTEPEDPKPFDELLSQLGGLGGLGALGGASAGGASSGQDSGASTGGASDAQLKEYTDCLEQAGEDLDAAQKCAEVLTP